MSRKALGELFIQGFTDCVKQGFEHLFYEVGESHQKGLQLPPALQLTSGSVAKNQA